MPGFFVTLTRFPFALSFSSFSHSFHFFFFFIFHFSLISPLHLNPSYLAVCTDTVSWTPSTPSLCTFYRMENNRLRPAPQEEGSSYRSVASPLTPAPNLPLHNQSTPSSSLPAQWKSSAIPLNRREQVHRYVGHIPTYTTSKSKYVIKSKQRTLFDSFLHHTHSRSRKYELIIREQPQQCRMSGFGEKDRRPIDPAPIVQLTVYEDDQPIDLK